MSTVRPKDKFIAALGADRMSDPSQKCLKEEERELAVVSKASPSETSPIAACEDFMVYASGSCLAVLRFGTMERVPLLGQTSDIVAISISPKNGNMRMIASVCKGGWALVYGVETEPESTRTYSFFKINGGKEKGYILNVAWTSHTVLLVIMASMVFQVDTEKQLESTISLSDGVVKVTQCHGPEMSVSSTGRYITNKISPTFLQVMRSDGAKQRWPPYRSKEVGPFAFFAPPKLNGATSPTKGKSPDFLATVDSLRTQLVIWDCSASQPKVAGHAKIPHERNDPSSGWALRENFSIAVDQSGGAILIGGRRSCVLTVFSLFYSYPPQSTPRVRVSAPLVYTISSSILALATYSEGAQTTKALIRMPTSLVGLDVPHTQRAEDSESDSSSWDCVSAGSIAESSEEGGDSSREFSMPPTPTSPAPAAELAFADIDINQLVEEMSPAPHETPPSPPPTNEILEECILSEWSR